MWLKLIFKFLLFAVTAEVALACNGYKIKILKSENCGSGDPVVTIDPEFTVKLSKKCEFIPTGCVLYKPFKTAVTKYKVVKDGIVVKEGKIDLCTLAEQTPDDIKSYMKVFGAPTSCPIESEAKICADDKKIDVSNFKSFLGLARGIIVIDSDITHDTGKSCFHLEVEISK